MLNGFKFYEMLPGFVFPLVMLAAARIQALARFMSPKSSCLRRKLLCRPDGEMAITY